MDETKISVSSYNPEYIEAHSDSSDFEDGSSRLSLSKIESASAAFSTNCDEGTTTPSRCHYLLYDEADFYKKTFKRKVYESSHTVKKPIQCFVNEQNMNNVRSLSSILNDSHKMEIIRESCQKYIRPSHHTKPLEKRFSTRQSTQSCQASETVVKGVKGIHKINSQITFLCEALQACKPPLKYPKHKISLERHTDQATQSGRSRRSFLSCPSTYTKSESKRLRAVRKEAEHFQCILKNQRKSTNENTIQIKVESKGTRDFFYNSVCASGSDPAIPIHRSQSSVYTVLEESPIFNVQPQSEKTPPQSKLVQFPSKSLLNDVFFTESSYQKTSFCTGLPMFNHCTRQVYHCPERYDRMDRRYGMDCSNTMSRVPPCKCEKCRDSPSDMTKNCQYDHDDVIRTLEYKYGNKVICIHEPPCVLINGCVNIPTQNKCNLRVHTTNWQTSTYDDITKERGCQYLVPVSQVQQCQTSEFRINKKSEDKSCDDSDFYFRRPSAEVQIPSRTNLYCLNCESHRQTNKRQHDRKTNDVAVQQDRPLKKCVETSCSRQKPPGFSNLSINCATKFSSEVSLNSTDYINCIPNPSEQTYSHGIAKSSQNTLTTVYEVTEHTQSHREPTEPICPVTQSISTDALFTESKAEELACAHVPVCQKVPKCLKSFARRKIKKKDLEKDSSDSCAESYDIVLRTKIASGEAGVQAQSGQFICRHKPPCSKVPKCLGEVMKEDIKKYCDLKLCEHKPFCGLIPLCCRKKTIPKTNVGLQYPAACKIT